jgi:dipeptidyl aminopeptidase/acylaminoacyl peptidase
MRFLATAPLSLAALAVVLLAPAEANGQQPQLLTPDVLLAEHETLSPPGPSVAWLPDSRRVICSRVFKDPDGAHVSQIEVLDTVNGSRRTLAAGSNPVPSPDGNWIAYFPSGAKETQIWVMRTAGTDSRQLTTVPGGLANRRARHLFVWAPDSRSIAFSFRPGSPPSTKQRSSASEVIVRGGANDVPPDTQVWVADVSSGESRKVHEGPYQINGLEWHPAGSQLVIAAYNYMEYRDDQSYGEVKVIDLNSGTVRTLVRDHGVQLLRPVPSPDGTQVAFTSFTENIPYPDFYRIAVVPFDGGPIRHLTEDTFVASGPLWAPDGSAIYFRAKIGAFTHICRVTLRGELQRITTGPQGASSPAVSPDGRRMIWSTRNARGSSDVRLANSDGSQERILEDLAPGLSRLKLGAGEEVRWRSRDGLEIAGFLIKPPDFREGQRYPLVVDLHGGPVGGASLAGSLMLSSPLEYHLWAARGFVVFAPDYRSSAVYGWDHVLKARQAQDANERDFDDIMTGVDRLIERGLVDPERMAILGHSYGAFLTNWVITQTNRFRVAVSYEGYADNYFVYGTQFTTGGNRVQEWLFNGKPWEVPENYRKSSPSEYVGRIRTPTLFISGQSADAGGMALFHNEFMYTALRQQKVPTRLLVYPGEGHVVRGPANLANLVHEALTWVETHMRK